MDERKCTVWEAASEVEAIRVAAGGWDHMLRTPSIKAFSKGESRVASMTRLKSVEFADVASAQILPMIVSPLQPVPVCDPPLPHLMYLSHPSCPRVVRRPPLSLGSMASCLFR